MSNVIYGIFGDVGSGKTLTMTKYAYFHYLMGYNIYSNYTLAFPHKKIDAEFLKDVAKGEIDDFEGKNAFFLHEFDVWIDSRSSMKESNKIISYFIKQVRKKRIKLFYDCQIYETVDVRLRRLTKKKIECESRELQIYKNDKHVKIVVIYNSLYINNKRVFTKRFVGNKYFGLYDTFELLEYVDDKKPTI